MGLTEDYTMKNKILVNLKFPKRKKGKTPKKINI